MLDDWGLDKYIRVKLKLTLLWKGFASFSLVDSLKYFSLSPTYVALQACEARFICLPALLTKEGSQTPRRG